MTLRDIQQAIADGRWHELSLQDLEDKLVYIEQLQQWLRKRPQFDIVTRELSRLVTLEDIIRLRIDERWEALRRKHLNDTPNV